MLFGLYKKGEVGQVYVRKKKDNGRLTQWREEEATNLQLMAIIERISDTLTAL